MKAELESMSSRDVIRQKRRRLQDRKSVWGLLGEILLTTALVFLAFSFVFGISAVDGDSMFPMLHDGDLTLFYRLDNGYEGGDVIIFEMDGYEEKLVKRVVATAGDVVEFDDTDGRLVVNGVIVPEALYETFSNGCTFPLTVPEGSVFVLGDHRTNSTDSRKLGCIDTQTVLGKVILCLRTREI